MRSVLVALATLALAACDSRADPEPVGDLVLSVVPDGFLLETEEEYECDNYPLDVRVNESTGDLVVDVLGVGEIDLCLTATGPASVIVPGPEEPGQAYDVVLRKGGRTDTFAFSCGIDGCALMPVGEPSFSRLGPG